MFTKSWKNRWINKNDWPESQFAKRVYTFIKNKKLKTMLEIGCGGGRDAQYFSKKGLKVTAIDIMTSKQQQEKLKKSGVQFIKRDIKDIKLKSSTFDSIYAHLSLHYFDDKTTGMILDNLHKALKPGGYIFIKCKSIDDPLYGQGKLIEDNFYQLETTRHFFSKEYMQEKLKKFKIVKISRTNTFKHPCKASFLEVFAQK